MAQRERQQPAAAIAWAAIQKARGGGGLFSGGALLDFKRGWALLPFNGARAHHLVLDGGTVWAACGRAWDFAGKGEPLLFEPGNFPRCVNCSSAMELMGKRGA